MKSRLLIMSFLLTSVYLFAQERVSNISNPKNQYNFFRWISLIDQEEYLIEQNDDETRISKLTLNEPILLHTLKERPNNEKKLFFGTSYETESLISYKEKQLIEVYSNSVRLTDIISGQLEKSISLDNDSININDLLGGLFGDTLFLVGLHSSGLSKLIVMNLATSHIDILPLTTLHAVRINDKIYRPENNKIFELNTKTKIENLFCTMNDTIKYFKQKTNKGNNYIVFGDREKELYQIKINNDLQKIDVPLPQNLYDISIKDSIITFSTYENTKRNSYIYNLKSRVLIYAIDHYLYQYDIKSLPQELILFRYEDDLCSEGSHFIFDLKTNSAHPIKGSSPQIYFKSPSCVKDNKLFLVGLNSVEFENDQLSFNCIDFSSFERREIIFNQNTRISEFTFRDFIDDSLKIIGSSYRKQIGLWTLSPRNFQATYKTSLIKPQNVGIQNLYQSLIDNDVLFSITDGGLYYTKGDSTHLILSCKFGSKMAKYNNYIFALVMLADGEIGFAKINRNNFNVTYKKLDGVKQIDPYHEVNNDAIFNPKGTDHNGNFFLDFKTETYKKIQLDNQSLILSLDAVSGNYVFITSYENFTFNYFIYNSTTSELNKITGLKSGKPYIYPLDNGSFYLALVENENKYIKRLTSNLKIEEVIEIPNLPHYYFDDHIGLDGPMKTFPVPGVNEIIFISEKNDVITTTKIPYYETAYHIPFFWMKKDNLTICETKDDKNNTNIWVWMFEGKPLKLNIPFTGFKIVKAFINKENIVILLNEVIGNNMKLIHYNFTQNSILDIKTLYQHKSDFQNYTYDIIALNADEYILSYGDGILGIEPWLYNTKTHDFTLLKDIYSGHASSNPTSYHVVNNNVYFLAKDNDQGIQWFKYHSNYLTKENELKNKLLIISPNPSSNIISILNRVYREVTILDFNGRTFLKYRYGQDIDIAKLPLGSYLVVCKDGNENYYGKFVKI